MTAVSVLEIAAVGRKRHLRLRRNRLADGREQRRAAVRHIAAPALPVNRPAAALHSQIVRRPADDGEVLDFLRERQNALFIFEQHERFAHGLARDGAMFRRADGGGQLWIRHGVFKKSELEFNPQNPAHRVVNARLRNFPIGHELLQVLDELDVVVRFVRAAGNHDHVQPGVDGLLDVVFVIGRKLVNRAPVGNQKTPEAKLALQNVGEQMLVAVHFRAVPTAVGNHDGTDAGLDGRVIRRQI